MMFSSLKEDDMTEAITPRSLTPPLLSPRLEAEMLEACAAVAAWHGLKAEALGITRMNLRWNFVFGVQVKRTLSGD